MHKSCPWLHWRDPRTYQVLALTGLLSYGLAALEFGVPALQILLTVGGAVVTQWVCTRLWSLPVFDTRSALISSLSLCLLLRTDSLWLALLAIMVTISSKFLIRIRNKHVFNPTNFGLAAMMLLFDGVWVSPGQWGTFAFFAFLMACLGGLVVFRAERSDVTYAFVLAYAGMLLARAAWLGDPWSIPLHQLQSGSFLLFSFFMISDPKTTPDHRLARILYAVWVAGLALFIQFALFIPNALIWSLVCSAPLVPLLDTLWRGQRYQWPQIFLTRRSSL